MPLPSRLLRCSLISALSAGGLIFSSIASNADVVTTLNFVSPGTGSPLTVPIGSTVVFDLGVSFVPLPAATGAPESIDDGTGDQMASCSTDPNPCTELQFNTSASTLVSVFAEAVAGNAPGPPNFFPTTVLGTSTFSQAYPNAGLWEITTAGTDQEQFVESECLTHFVDMMAGGPVCMTIGTFSFTGAFDPGGSPAIFVDAVAAAVPEPFSFAIVGTGLLGCWAFCRGRRRPTAERARVS